MAGQKWGCAYAARILELMEVLATLIKLSLPSLSTFVDNCSAMNLHASLHASLKCQNPKPNNQRPIFSIASHSRTLLGSEAID